MQRNIANELKIDTAIEYKLFCANEKQIGKIANNFNLK